MPWWVLYLSSAFADTPKALRGFLNTKREVLVQLDFGISYSTAHEYVSFPASTDAGA